MRKEILIFLISFAFLPQVQGQDLEVESGFFEKTETSESKEPNALTEENNADLEALDYEDSFAGSDESEDGYYNDDEDFTPENSSEQLVEEDPEPLSPNDSFQNTLEDDVLATTLDSSETVDPQTLKGLGATTHPDQLNRTQETLIPHPLAQKGLTRITSKNEYIYELKTSPQSRASTFLISTFEPTQFEGNAMAGSATTYFEDIYSSSILFTGDYEWQLYNIFLGKLGVKLGSGFMVTSGKGVYASTGSVSPEEYSFFLFPNVATAIWRMQIWDKQLLVPYVEAGGGYYTFLEMRANDGRVKVGGAPVVLGAVGAYLQLGAFSRDAIRTLDRDYGINALSLNVEFRAVQGMGKFDLSHSSISGGFGFEY